MATENLDILIIQTSELDSDLNAAFIDLSLFYKRQKTSVQISLSLEYTQPYLASGTDFILASLLDGPILTDTSVTTSLGLEVDQVQSFIAAEPGLVGVIELLSEQRSEAYAEVFVPRIPLEFPFDRFQVSDVFLTLSSRQPDEELQINIAQQSWMMGILFLAPGQTSPPPPPSSLVVQTYEPPSRPIPGRRGMETTPGDPGGEPLWISFQEAPQVDLGEVEFVQEKDFGLPSLFTGTSFGTLDLIQFSQEPGYSIPLTAESVIDFKPAVQESYCKNLPLLATIRIFLQNGELLTLSEWEKPEIYISDPIGTVDAVQLSGETPINIELVVGIPVGGDAIQYSQEPGYGPTLELEARLQNEFVQEAYTNNPEADLSESLGIFNPIQVSSVIVPKLIDGPIERLLVDIVEKSHFWGDLKSPLLIPIEIDWTQDSHWLPPWLETEKSPLKFFGREQIPHVNMALSATSKLGYFRPEQKSGNAPGTGIALEIGDPLPLIEISQESNKDLLLETHYAQLRIYPEQVGHLFDLKLNTIEPLGIFVLLQLSDLNHPILAGPERLVADLVQKSRVEASISTISNIDLDSVQVSEVNIELQAKASLDLDSIQESEVFLFLGTKEPVEISLTQASETFLDLDTGFRKLELYPVQDSGFEVNISVSSFGFIYNPSIQIVIKQ